MKARTEGFSYLRLVVLWSLFFASCLLLTACDSQKTIVHELDEKEANEIVDLLSRENIDAVKVKSLEGGAGQKLTLWNVNVPADKSKEALSILNQNGFPRRRGQTLLGIFKETGLVPSEMTEKVRFQSGLAENLASTIRKIDGVLDAEVQLSFPEEDPLNPASHLKKKVTASVYIKHSALLDDPNVHLDTKIKRYVASSVANLDYDDVTVIMDRARFGDVQLSAGSSPEAEKRYTSIWTVIVAEESASRFRLIFFSFSMLFLLFLLSMGWLFWKFYPVIKAGGGFKELWTMAPFEPGKPKEGATEEELEPIEDEAVEEEKGKAEPDMDKE